MTRRVQVTRLLLCVSRCTFRGVGLHSDPSCPPDLAALSTACGVNATALISHTATFRLFKAAEVALKFAAARGRVKR